jgi:Tol biopolymer transport system component
MLAIKVSSANVRGGPGVAYAILGAASGDQKLRLTGRLASGEWWQVEYQGRPGWVAASVATAPGDTSTIPVISVIPPTPSGAVAPAASGPAAAGGGHIAFASGRGDGSDLALLDVSTGNVSTVAENGRQPDMFSDGRIVFKGAGNGRDNIFTVRSDGGSLKQITAFGEDQWPLWSSSGKELSYFSTSGQQPERVCVQRDLSGPVGDPLFRVETITRRNGTPNPVYGRYPAWVANNRIAFTGCDTWVNGNNCGLWSLDVDNWTEFRPYPLAGDQEARASDSFGDTLLYSSPAAGNWEILAVRTSLPARRDTPKPVPVNLTNNSAQDVGASFSPDGKQIAFISNRGGSWGIWVMNPDGGNARLLASVPPGFGPHWDAERVAWGP